MLLQAMDFKGPKSRLFPCLGLKGQETEWSPEERLFCVVCSEHNSDPRWRERASSMQPDLTEQRSHMTSLFLPLLQAKTSLGWKASRIQEAHGPDRGFPMVQLLVAETGCGRGINFIQMPTLSLCPCVRGSYTEMLTPYGGVKGGGRH